jgi:hypothetical protein
MTLGFSMKPLIRDQGNQIERAVVFRETPVRLQAKSSSAPIDRLTYVQRNL